MRRVLALILFALPAAAGSLADLEKRVTKHTLANGLRVLVYERHGIPTFTGAIGVAAGSVDDPKGGTGLAHMFEHMAFKGTTVIRDRDGAKEQELMREEDAVVADLSAAQSRSGVDPAALDASRKRLKEIEDRQRAVIIKDEFVRIYTEAGGSGLNATTDNDLTRYFISLPANRLEMWFLMESERFEHPVLREFYTERDVVKEERRIYDDTPDGKLLEEFFSSAFRAHPYHEPVVGWMEDLNQITRGMAAAFHSTYYVPSNTVVAIVGDVDPKQAIAYAEKYFGDAPAAPPPPAVTTREPAQRGERSVDVEWDAEPQFLIGFHKPTYPDRDAYIMDVISSILTNGRTSRLYDRLVKKERKASDVSAFTGPGDRFANLLILAATPVAPATTEELIQEIQDELARLAREPVSREELARVVNQTRANQIRAVSGNRFAFTLLYYELMFNNWRLFLEADSIVAGITPEDIMRVAARYFTRENRTVGRILRAAAPAKEASDAQ